MVVFGNGLLGKIPVAAWLLVPLQGEGSEHQTAYSKWIMEEVKCEPPALARGVRGVRTNPLPPHTPEKVRKTYYICIVHVGDDDLTRSGVYVRIRICR